MVTDWRPGFLVIGAYKSGTTSVHNALRAHPQLYVPRRKEPGFFAFEGATANSHPKARDCVRDIDAYLQRCCAGLRRATIEDYTVCVRDFLRLCTVPGEPYAISAAPSSDHASMSTRTSPQRSVQKKCRGCWK